jgi:hypothetical protein
MSDPADLDAAEVRSRLGLPARMMAWLERIERPPGSRGPVLPDGERKIRRHGRLHRRRE